MPDSKDIRIQLQQARAQREETRVALFLKQEKLKSIEAEQARLNRIFNQNNNEHVARRDSLERARLQTQADLGNLRESYATITDLESKSFRDFFPFTDPRTQVKHLSDSYPFLLFPVRIETRFKTIETADGAKTQLWVRIYPDDCSIDAFESVLSEMEIDSAQSYWAEIWRAGGVEDHERGAWRSLVGTHGSGRAAWIIQHYQPLNIEDKPQKTNEQDVILVIATDTPLAEPEKTDTDDFWKAVWLADGDRDQEENALNAFRIQVGEARAQEIIEDYKPTNLDDKPTRPRTRRDVSVEVAMVVFPKPDEVETKQLSWTQAAKVNILPDRFVVMAYVGDTKVLEVIGNPIPSPLVIGPDPSAPPEDQMRWEDDKIIMEEDRKWLVDFDRAIEVGMAIKSDLTPEQGRDGFDRLIVLGLRLSSDEVESRTLLETLFHNHYYGRSGFSILPQGTPTNNTEKSGSGFTLADDPDASFDIFVKKKDPEDWLTDDWLTKKDGQWLAECLGIAPEVLQNVTHSRATDQCEAKAMNIALWPATLGYFLETMMDPVFEENTINQTRWFFNLFVSGRGMIPAIRIGSQPYGILPTTAWSRMKWVFDEQFTPILGLTHPDGFRGYLRKLYLVLSRISADWSSLVNQVSYVGKPGDTDAHQTLLDILGLHSGSVEYYERYAESFVDLWNRVRLAGQSGQSTSIAEEWSRFIENSMELLRQFGYGAEEIPAILNKAMFENQNLLCMRDLQIPHPDAQCRGSFIDDRPLSETEKIRKYTPDPNGRNYIEWLSDALQKPLESLETIRLEKGFIDNKPPTALLYLLLRHAIELGYWDASIRLYEEAGLLSGKALEAARREPDFIHVRENAEHSESRWYYLYRAEPRITQTQDLLVADYVSKVIGQAPATQYLNEQIKALEHLKDVPTARLERALAEHIDCCSYRLDAWKLGLIHYQLASMRYRTQEQDRVKVSQGIYLGAYSWLEDIRPKNKILTPVDLDPELNEIFNKPEDAPLVKDSTNAGYIHAPSLNHAVTAAVLRAGYIANATRENPEFLSINLSSERVRLALSIIEGIRNGQSLAALLGYQFERGLHDRHDVIVDEFIFKLRKAFPLYADRLATTRTPDDVAIEAIEARNVINGLDLINHINETDNETYPFGITSLPSASPEQTTAINEEVNRIMNIHDAVADLALPESVHQVVQGNYDRAAATLDAYSKSNFPPLPDVIQTPRSGITWTHHVALHLEAGLDPDISLTPRAQAEPAINKWLAGILPLSQNIACKVRYFDQGTNTHVERVVTQQDLRLQPIDLLYMITPESQQAMTELDDRVVNFIITNFIPRPDAPISIKYTERITDKVTFFELTPLIKSLRQLILRSRPLRPGDITLQNEASSDNEKAVFLNDQRIVLIRDHLETLRTRLRSFQVDLESLLADVGINRTRIINNIDQYINDLVALFSAVGLYGIPQTGIGFALDWKRQLFSAIIRKVDDLVNRWQDKMDRFDELLDEYDALPPETTSEERFALLQKAERLVSMRPTISLPPGADEFVRIVLEKREQFGNKKRQFGTILQTTATTIAALLSDVKAQLPISDWDLIEFDLADQEKQIVLFAEDLVAHAKGLADDLDKRLIASNEQLSIPNGTTQATVRVQALLEAGKILLGEGFRMVPEFSITPEQGDEWEKAWNSTDQLLDFQINLVGSDFPVDDWLYGIARVREKLCHWENIMMLTRAFGKAEPELRPVQLPYKENENWLALSFPENYKIEGESFLAGDYKIDGDRLFYTAHYAVPFDKTQRQCGLLLDEWTEVIPAKTENTGIASHFDRPSSEPPQVMLLVTPPDFRGSWQWQDLVDALQETWEMTQQRAIEPQQIDATAYAPFLPATLMAATRHPITIATILGVTNGLFSSEA